MSGGQVILILCAALLVCVLAAGLVLFAAWGDDRIDHL